MLLVKKCKTLQIGEQLIFPIDKPPRSGMSVFFVQIEYYLEKTVVNIYKL